MVLSSFLAQLANGLLSWPEHREVALLLWGGRAPCLPGLLGVGTQGRVCVPPLTALPFSLLQRKHTALLDHFVTFAHFLD